MNKKWDSLYNNCDECKRLFRNKSLRKYKDKLICYQCWVKNIHQIQCGGDYSGISFEDAIKKVYKVKGYSHGKNSIQATCYFPSILIGKKFKLVIIE